MVHHEAAKEAAGGRGVIGTILCWRQEWRKRALRRSGSMSRGDRIQLRNILQCKRLCTSVNDLFGGQECGCINIGGSSKART